MAIKIIGILILAAYSFLVFVFAVKGNLAGATFVSGIWYGLILIFRKKIGNAIIPKNSKLLFRYGFLVFISGMVIEVLAYIASIPSIQKTGTAYLFSTSLPMDLLIAFPHYAAVGFTWSWVIKRFNLSALQQVPLIVIFWGMSLDGFSHLRALLAGNVLDFVLAGLIMVYAFNWPLAVMQDKFKELYPNRNNGWIKFPIAFFIQILPIIILIITKKLLMG